MTSTTSSTSGADPIITNGGKHLHYYRPIAMFDGAVLKYSGMASANNLAAFPLMCMEAGEGFKAGLVILPAYAGDRIMASTLQEYRG